MYKKRKWKDVLTIISGKNQKAVETVDGKYPIYGSGGIIGHASSFLCPAKTVIVGRKGTIDRPIYVEEPFWNIDTAFGVVAGEELLPKYLYFFCLSYNFKSLDKSTGRPSVSKSDLLKIEMPLPSLKEQTDTVTRIEELFSELDKGVETLQTIKQQLAVYRQAVLKEAFEGINSTKYMVKDVCKDIKVGIVIKPSQYYTDAQQGIKAFRSANVKEFHINNSDWVYLSQAGHSINSRSVVHTDDILIVRSGYPGTSCVVTEQFDGCNAIDILIAVPNKEIVLPQFLCAYTNSPFGKAFVSEKKRGVAQKHFNVSGYSKMMLPVPDLNKQREIVQEIESRLSVCDSIEQTVDTALSQAEAMRQSILKKAFEGGFSE